MRQAFVATYDKATSHFFSSLGVEHCGNLFRLKRVVEGMETTKSFELRLLKRVHNLFFARGSARSQHFPITLSVCVTSIEQPLRIPFCSATGHIRGAEKFSLTSCSVSPECPRSAILCLVLAGSCRSASACLSLALLTNHPMLTAGALWWPKACPYHRHSGCLQPWHCGHPHCALHHHE